MRPASNAEPPNPTVGELGRCFLTLGLTGFGGVLPHARFALVEKRAWLSSEEFNEILGLCQIVPGGNIINMSIAVGRRFRGVPGAATCFAALLAAPTMIVILIGMAYAQTENDIRVQSMLAGAAAAGAGLLIALAVKTVGPLLPRPTMLAISVLCFFAIAIFRLPMLPIIVGLALVAMVIHVRTR
jgi:chromate transporter